MVPKQSKARQQPQLQMSILPITPGMFSLRSRGGIRSGCPTAAGGGEEEGSRTGGACDSVGDVRLRAGSRDADSGCSSAQSPSENSCRSGDRCGGGGFKRALHGMSKLWTPSCGESAERGEDRVGVVRRAISALPGGATGDRDHQLTVTLPRLSPGNFHASDDGENRSGDGGIGNSATEENINGTRIGASVGFPEQTLHSDSTLTSPTGSMAAMNARALLGTDGDLTDSGSTPADTTRSPSRPRGEGRAGHRFDAGAVSAADHGKGMIACRYDSQHNTVSPAGSVFTETGASTLLEEAVGADLSSTGGSGGRGALLFGLSASLGSVTTAATNETNIGSQEEQSVARRSISMRQAERLVFGDGVLSDGTGVTEENTTVGESTVQVSASESKASLSRAGRGDKERPSNLIAARQHRYTSDDENLESADFERCRPSPLFPERVGTSSSSSDTSNGSYRVEKEDSYFNQGIKTSPPPQHFGMESLTPVSCLQGVGSLPRPGPVNGDRKLIGDSDMNGPSVCVSPIERIPYVHCGYAPAAPHMLQDARWMDILRQLMPEAYSGVSALLRHAAERASDPNELVSGPSPALDQARVMKWAENNPVVAAYGMLNSKGGGRSKKDEVSGRSASVISGGKAGWPPKSQTQSQVPPPPVDSRFSAERKLRRQRLQGGSCRSEVGIASLAPTHRRRSSDSASFSSSKVRVQKTPLQPKPALEWDVFLDPILVRHVDKALQTAENLNVAARRMPSEVSYEQQVAADVEVDRQVARLMDRMILAHGSTTQLVAEAVGMAPRYNFSRVVEQGESKRRTESRRRRGKSGGGSVIYNKISKSPNGVIPEEGSKSQSPSVASIASAHTAQQVVAVAEAEGVRGSKSAPSAGIFVDRWLALFAKALRMGIEWSNGYHLERALSHRSSIAASPRFVRSHRSNVSALSDFSAIDSAVGSSADNESATNEANDPIQAAPPLCGIFLCFGMDDPNSIKADHGKSSMADNARIIMDLLGSPLRVVMDLKSRRVPPRVWARLVDNLRSRGLCIDGLGSFNIDELRSIGYFCSTPVTQVIFFHSAGDMQRACHAREITHGDTVFFNAGSLLWKRPSLCEASGFGWCASQPTSLSNDDACGDINANDIYNEQKNKNGIVFNGYVFQPYAYPRDKMKALGGLLPDCKATLGDYQKHLNLNIGLYVQEFSIGPSELDALIKLVNKFPTVYNLGLAWGGINGSAVRGVEGDGFWNQRYIGRNWDFAAEPAEQMKLLNPEDHHMWQKAIHAGDWAQLATINQIAIDPEEQEGPLGEVHMCKPH